jgi:hypothetical protein
MSLLSWRAVERRDRAALQQFTCTVPLRPYRPNQPRHPKQWELEVQSGIRALQPPVGPDQILLVGEDATGIAAVTLSAEQNGGPAIVKLQAIAVATRCRGRGGKYADEALQVTLDAIGARARNGGLTKFIAVGWIDPRNHPSKLMCQRAGFAHLGSTPQGLEEWGMAIDLGLRTRFIYCQADRHDAGHWA